MKLLKELCEIRATSGDEKPVRDFLLAYIQENSSSWKKKPEMFFGEAFQDCLILKFGEPRMALFAHMDTVGFTVRYHNQLIAIGSPEAESGTVLVGEDELGPVEGKLIFDRDHHAFCQFSRPILPGTVLTYKVNFKSTAEQVQSSYLDNRLGVWLALNLARDLEDGILVFSCWEEHGGGSVPYLIKFIYENWKINKSIIADVTWCSEGVVPGEGVVISLRDRNIPRKSFTRKIAEIAREKKIPFQLEVEGLGSSDGRELQLSPFPIDWCFIGPPQQDAHSPKEKVHRKDIESTLLLYQNLFKIF